MNGLRFFVIIYSNEVNIMKITKKTYDKNVKKFAKRYDTNFTEFNKLFNQLGLTDDEMENIYILIDKRVDIVYDQIDYCYKNKIDECKFNDDIMNNEKI